MTVGDKVRIVGQSRFASRTGTIVDITDDEHLPYRVVLKNYIHEDPIPFGEWELVKREETE